MHILSHQLFILHSLFYIHHSAKRHDVRSACVMKWPESYQANFKTDAIAQYCDILPTLIDAAGGTAPSNLDGRSLLPLIKGETEAHREHAYFLFNNRHDRKIGPHFSSRAVTDGQYKLIWNLTPENMYGVAAISGIDFGKHNKGSGLLKERDCVNLKR